ncbi:bifunctional UDP-N-acetylglucosamine diphosphorylase/glucosamine-1-phosphate N-acetyltransferase GlmU [Methyloligella sp. 2.7D]|uniref:bifunctional UDP-N-acetylglucosamine diphosphorylase/glucosamine-1-phosphate N-acetyltransferase GlmU n=1 Tax=unclassified Methyloligella TaxID=2625955 RepID=UPI00157BD4AB|nr:bifunctional UDP-N-acetylglucosamine diphosphorylase/glucosamine-1-phosphate N-acetyltransferase GlmU [Methyloligella sp. GL2]QKP77669.1 bifunctional UDP-N-acetylglucosamine diphosphorylase/glucosamine-1-phosphate N-acetyltransferase GlmU [Methyloligella sp. GL2]
MTDSATPESDLTAVILAAGKGTRMKSALPKVLHALAGAPMLAHVMAAVKQAGIGKQALVVGPGMEDVTEAAEALAPGIASFIQADQQGTADAVSAAKDAIAQAAGPVLVLYGDTPLLHSATLSEVGKTLKDGADIVVVGFEPDDPAGYGRLMLEPSGALIGIREDKDASEEERKIRLCNSGIMGFCSGKTLLELLSKIGNDNAKGEYYLTDAVGLAAEAGLTARIVTADPDTVLGVNSRAELAIAETVLQERIRTRVMAEGATLIAPETVFFSYDTEIGRDVVIEPNVVFGPGVSVGDGVVIRAFCRIEGATIGESATIGPFARLRPGAELAASAHVGNFVEIKKARVGTGAKVNHLTYIGDAVIGQGANIGAGTITCNYDGFDKYLTEIGEEAFVGSNSALVAPVKIGDGAYVGSGSVITSDVAPGALALTRAPQEERADWATRFRARRARAKKDGNNGK